MCINYYKLNAIIHKDRYPLPLINETIANIIGYKIITKLNVQKAFNRICIIEESKELTTFYSPLRNFKSKVLPFNLYNSLVTF